MSPRLREACLAIPALLLGAWALGATVLVPVPALLRAALTLGFALAAVALWRTLRRFSPWLWLAAAGLALGITLRVLPSPSHDRDWVEPHGRLAEIAFENDRVRVRNVRNFRYGDRGQVLAAAWEERAFDLARLDSAWFGVTPFGSIPGVGHVFVSFGFDDGRYLAVSVEARRERNEAYSPLAGHFRAYEMIYVLGDERDVVALRSNVWQDPVYLYPIRSPPELLRAAFLDVMQRAAGLAREPEFYDTVLNSCSSNLARHVNRVVPGRVPQSLNVLLPAWSDELAHEVGLIDFDGTLAQARERFLINARAAGDVDTGDFSARIRTVPARE